MRLLILGGTRFVGRHIAEAALAQNHEVTLFHRGVSAPELFEGRVERIVGDREKDLSRLGGRPWDAVIDTCGYVPRIVRESAAALRAENTDLRYLFVSSVSVYDRPPPGADESWPVGAIEDRAVEEITGETYGPLKALCEAEVRESYGHKAIIVRPGLIAGPHDPTDRFPYWVARISAGGDVLLPGRKRQPIQIIDVRDLAAFCLGLLNSGLGGTWNAVGPEAPLTLGGLFDSMFATLNPGARPVWVDPARLEEWGVKPWSDLPLYWGPNAEEDGVMAVSNRRALDSGLKIRPLEVTVRDTRDWLANRPTDQTWKAGLARRRERELLEMWWS
jgi:2'-hydroxyisoflavone reductase